MVGSFPSRRAQTPSHAMHCFLFPPCPFHTCILPFIPLTLLPTLYMPPYTHTHTHTHTHTYTASCSQNPRLRKLVAWAHLTFCLGGRSLPSLRDKPYLFLCAWLQLHFFLPLCPHPPWTLTPHFPHLQRLTDQEVLLTTSLTAPRT